MIARAAHRPPARIGINTLFLIPGRTGGTEPYVRQLVRALGDLDGDEEYVVYVNREAAGTFGGSARVRERVCGVNASSRAARIAYEQLVLPLHARRDRVDVLHSPGYTAPLAAHCPQLVTIHDVNYHFHPDDWSAPALLANRLLIPRVARRADLVATVSQTSKRAIVELLGVPAERVEVVYPGVDHHVPLLDADAIARARRRHAVDGDFILTVAASHPHKNLDGLIAAYDVLAGGTDGAPPLVIVAGVPGRAHAQLRALAERPRVRGRVILVGWIGDDELSALYRAATLFVLPSKYEGFGFPVLEAMTAHVPVAAADAASLPEVAGGAALLFDPHDRAAIAAAMRRGLADGDERDRLRRRGRARAAEFTWRRAAEQMRALYRRFT